MQPQSLIPFNRLRNKEFSTSNWFAYVISDLQSMCQATNASNMKETKNGLIPRTISRRNFSRKEIRTKQIQWHLRNQVLYWKIDLFSYEVLFGILEREGSMRVGSLLPNSLERWLIYQNKSFVGKIGSTVDRILNVFWLIYSNTSCGLVRFGHWHVQLRFLLFFFSVC